MSARTKRLGGRTPSELYEVSMRSLPAPSWGRDFDYDTEADVVRVSKLGYIATHRGSVFLSVALSHQLLELDWYERNRARVYFGTLLLGELRAKPKRRDLQFFPVEAKSKTAPSSSLAANPATSYKPSPMSSDSVPF